MAVNPSIQLGTSGNWAIKEDNLLAYKQLGSKFFNREFDFSRGTTATFVGTNGLIQESAIDVPRIDFKDDTTGRLLLEPQSTNTINNSNVVGKMQYYSHITRTNNVAISPDGTFNAMGLIPTATSGIHRAGYSSNAGLYTQNDIVTLSCFVKANGYNFVTVGGFFGQEKAVFNISNGTLISQENNVINTKIVKLANDWYRLSTTYTFQNQINNGYLYAGIYVMDSETGYAFTADGVSGVYSYGFQTELGTGTSYIPTSGSAVTRNQETCNNSGTVGDFNSQEGVLYVEIAALNDSSDFYIGIYGNSNSRIRLVFSPNQVKGQVFNGSYQARLSSSQTISNNNKVAFKYKQDDFALWINGVEVDTDNSGLTFNANTITYLNLASYTGASNLVKGRVKCVAVYKEALTDEELQELTT